MRLTQKQQQKSKSRPEERYSAAGQTRYTHPLPQVIREKEISGKMVGERRVEFQHLLQGITLYDMEVTVGQCAHVCTSLGKGHLLPEHIPKHISLTCRKSIKYGGFLQHKPIQSKQPFISGILLCCNMTSLTIGLYQFHILRIHF